MMKVLSAVAVVLLSGLALAQAPPDTSGAVAYDDGITWSWEEEVEPLDVLQFMQELPYDEEVEIGELTLRRLFEDIVLKALDMMEITGDGGDFEKTLRRYLLYFRPEVEYYWPPYEEDFPQREVKFPIKVKKGKNSEGIDYLQFHLGRYGDNERDVIVHFDDDGMDIRVFREKYLPGKPGPPKIEGLFFAISYKYQAAALARAYYGSEDFVAETSLQGLKRYKMGSSEPEIDNLQNEPPLDLSGVGILFDLPYDKWRIWGNHLLQTYRGIINLCKLQLNLIDNGYELEKYLWRDFFRFDRGVDYFGVYSESANARREATSDSNREVFKFRVGNINTARTIYITLSREFAPPGYEWGVEQISLSRPIMVNGAVGEEVRLFEFGWGADRIPYALYMLTQSDNEGYTILDRGIAYFEYGNPENLIGVAP